MVSIEQHVYIQESQSSSPWSVKKRILMLVWEYTWLLLCSWTPKPANRWRLLWLRAFGARIYGIPFVHQRARIQIPWNLTLHDQSCLGDRANIYSLGTIEIHKYAVVAQEAYLCTGTHLFDEPAKNLVTSSIIVGTNAFIGARAFILPGVTVGEHAIIGACSVVTNNIAAQMVCAGNPCKPIRKRNAEVAFTAHLSKTV